MSEKDRLEKNARIKKTALATRKRRRLMVLRTREVKITKNRLNRTQKEQLERMFLEAKWLRNSALGQGRFDRDYLKELGPTVPVKLPDGEYDSRPFKVLGGQLKQAVIDQLKRDRNALAALKKKGHKVGALKFTPEVKSIDLVQPETSYALDLQKGKVRVANIKGWMSARGLKQLEDIDEVGNAKLVRRPNGYFLIITTYTKRRPDLGRQTQKPQAGTELGIDMGVKTHLTLSDGTKIDALFEETDRLRRLRRKMGRQQKGSANWRKTLTQIRKESAKIVRRKDDYANKVTHEILKNEKVFLQDENLTGWKNKNGYIKGSKRIHASILGRIKQNLADHPRAVMLDKWQPTTATCVCGQKTKHHPDKRQYHCPACGYTADRDTHAAKNMIRLGKAQNSPRTEHTGTLVETSIRPAATMDYQSITSAGRLSVKQEAATSSGSP